MRAAPTSIILATCGLMLPALHTIAAVALAQPTATTAAAAPTAETAKLPKASPEHIAKTQAAISALVEKYQSPRGRDASGPNAYTSLIDALDAMQRTSHLVWRGESGTTRDGATPPDFTLIYSGTDADRQSPAYATALGQIAVLRASDLGAHLDAVAAAARSVRPVQRSSEHRRLMLVTGSDPANDAASSGYLIEMLLPELGPARFIARYNVALMHLAAQDGDTDAFLRAAEHNLALSRTLAHNFTVIDRLVSHAIIAVTVDYASRLIETAFIEPASASASNLKDPRFLAALDAVISRQLADLPSVSLNIEGEKLAFIDILPVVYGEGDAPLPDGWNRFNTIVQSDPPAVATPIARKQEIACADAIYGRMISFTEAPWDKAKVILRDFQGDGEFGPQKLTPMLKVMAAWVSKIKASNMQTDSLIVGLRTMLALRLYQAQFGSLPESLADIKSLSAVASTDPYTGKPLGYRTVDSKRFELWVAGYDGTDNGGSYNTEDRFAPVTGKPTGEGKDFRVFPPAD